MAKSLDLQVILAARDKVTGPLKKINATSDATAKALKQSQEEMRSLQKAQSNIASFKRMEGALKKNSDSLSEAQERVRQLKHQITTTDKPTAKLRKQFDKARKDVEKLTDKTQDQRKALHEVRGRLQDAGINVRNLGDEEKRLTQQLQKANKKIERQKKHLDQLGKADVGGKFRNMTGEVGRFGRRALFATGGAAAGIFGLTNSTANLGDQVAKTADKIGIGIGEFQELRYAGERSGVSTEKLDSSLERYVKRLGEATQGTGAARKAYEQLGLSADELSQMTPEESLGIVADRLQSVENQSQKVAIAAQLFGREGVAMVNMLKDGSTGLRQLREDARRTGYVLSDQAARDAETFKDALLDAQLGLAGMKNTIGAELMPAVTELMGDLSSWMQENRDQVKAFAAEFGTRLKNAIPVIRDIAVGAASAARTLGAITSALANLVGGFDNLGMILAFLFALKPVLAMMAFAKAIFTAGSAVIGLAGGLPAIASGIKAIGVALVANPIGLVIAGIAAAIGGLVYLVYKYWDQITGAFTSMIDVFKGIGSAIMDGLIGGITGGLKKVKDTVVNAGKSTIGWFKDVLGIKSPSRVFMSAGHDTLEGYRKGLEQQEPSTLKQVSGFGQRVRKVGAGIAIGASALPSAAGVGFDNRAPIAAGGGASIGGDTITIQITPTANQSSQDIAMEVERILQERDRRKAMRAGSALYDRE